MLPDEAVDSINKLKKEDALVESIHFHLRTNVSSASSYALSLKELSEVCNAAKFSPLYIDCGGGLPVAGERPVIQRNEATLFDLSKLRTVFKDLHIKFPNTKEIWLENGRFITARSALLVVKVIDIKERPDSRYLICDGGRTNHALVSDWEIHDIFSLPLRDGPSCLTTVCGPTCMAFDRLIRINLPNNIQTGDYIIWMNAGAYHIPWETRFSLGLAQVIWCDENRRLSIAREKESFSNWWNQWL
jgi:diaminopimelate decarboxylase